MRKRDHSGSGEISPNYQMSSVNYYHNTEMSTYQKVEPSAPPLPSMEIDGVEEFLVAPLINITQNKSEDSYTTYLDRQAIANPINPVEVSISEVAPYKPKEEKLVFRDIWAAILFIINVIALLYFAIKSANTITVQESLYGNENGTVSWNGLLSIFYFIIGFAVTATIITHLWLSILLKCAGALIDIQLKVNIILVFVSSVLSLLLGNLIGFIFFLICGFMNIWYYYSVADRIPFASAVLGTASRGVNAHFTGIVVTAIGALLLQLGWIVIWSLATYGIYNDPNYFSKHKVSSNNDDGLDGLQIGLIFVVFLSLYWGIQTMKYVLQTTVGGTIACWWFQPDRQYAVRGSLFRATTTSFGSICFGALLVAIIQSLREILQIIRNQRKRRQRSRSRSSSNTAIGDVISSIVVCFADCILKMLEDLLVYINRFAFCYVAAYGYSFVESGTKVYELFKQRGWIAVINDNLIGNCLSLVMVTIAITMGIIGGFVGVFWSDYLVCSSCVFPENTDSMTVMWSLIIIAAIIGAAVSQIFVNILDSAVAMVFVCYAENPEALKNNHPAAYDDLFQSWNYMMPIEECGYSSVSPEADVDYQAAAQAYSPEEPPYIHQPRGHTYADTGHYPNQSQYGGNYRPYHPSYVV